MKAFYFAFLIFGSSLLSNVTHAQTILIANNNPGAPSGTAGNPNVYTSLTAAISAANAGDIIYVVPSSINYGDITVNKALTLFGAGLIPDKDLGIKTSVGVLNITASDVRISGLIGTNTWDLGNGVSNTSYSNITIENCRFPALRHVGTNITIGNLLIRNNVIESTSITIDLKTTASVIITNNIFNMFCCSSFYGLIADGVTYSYNIFRYNGTTGNDGILMENVDNCLFEYNIFWGVPPNIPDGSIDNTFNYNLSFGNSDNLFSEIGTNGNTGTGNITGDPLFVDLPLGDTWSDSYDPAVGGGSPATDIDGITGDAGVAGGLTPWDPDGSLLPTIQSVTIPSVIPVGSDLNVNVTGKGN